MKTIFAMSMWPRLAILVALLLIVACGSAEETPTPAATPTSVPEAPSATQAPAPTQVPGGTSGPNGNAAA